MAVCQDRVIALGFFDGVHLGHGALLRRAALRAAELGARSAALTFDVQPAALISGKAAPLLTSCEDRIELMRELYGTQDVIVAHCDQALIRTPWRQFLDDLVREKHAVHLVAGHDFRFGWHGEGDPERLAAWCREHGLGCDVIGPVTLDGVLVSSTHIRTLISAGDAARAAGFLGHLHRLSGTVAHGKGLGGRLGFPTANLTVPPGLLIPARGVYAARITAEGRQYAAVTNVGTRPTVDDGDRVTVESCLLDFRGDLYGKPLRVELREYLRPEQKFDSLDALREQIALDAERARRFDP